MRRLNQSWIGLGAGLSLLGLLCLGGCSSSVEQATAEDVTNRAFAFADGAVFHAALASTPTTLLFLENATAFMLLSANGSGSASGTNRFGSCLLTVTASAYALGDGPQVGDEIILQVCEFDRDNSTLTVSRGGVTITSASAIARVVEATASDVRNRSFIFASGEVFDPGLTDDTTTLSFNGNATEFILGSNDGTASGPVQFGSCELTVRSSNYRSGNGPATGTVITLSICRFNSGSRSLIVSNGTIVAQST